MAVGLRRVDNSRVDHGGRPTLVIHGFGYDPEDSRHDPQEFVGTIARWAASCGPIEPFVYYSVPPGIGGLLRSWRHGRWNRYRHAWDLADAAAERLTKRLEWYAARGLEVNVVCHSLGSRVLFLALEKLERNPIHRVIVFNGADHVEHVRGVMSARPAAGGTQILNVVVETDMVLMMLGSHWAPAKERLFRSAHKLCLGNVGLGGLGAVLDGWVDLSISPAVKPVPELAWVNGDNPDSFGDHSWSFRNPYNDWLWKAWLRGEVDPVPVRQGETVC